MPWVERWFARGSGSIAAMKTAPFAACALYFALLVLPAPAAGQLPEDLVALHWHPATAKAARQRTLAAAAWLKQDTDSGDWRQAVEALELRLADSLVQVGPVRASRMDGLLAWLVHQRGANFGSPEDDFPAIDLADIDRLLGRAGSAGELARMETAVAWGAAGIWSDVAARVGEPAAGEMADFWAPVTARLPAAANGEEAPALAHARRQARRLERLASAPDEERPALIDAVLIAQASHDWQEGRFLDAVWSAYEALARLTVSGQGAAELAGAWRDWFEALDAERVRESRLVDTDLPVIIALLGDAAGYMASSGAAGHSAIGELADVYARLVLFAPDLAFYLEQPVREPIRRVLAACRIDPLLIGPLPRETFERCAGQIGVLFDGALGSEELVGDANAPFAPEILRREMRLVSWQRATYLDGHLAWMMDLPCQPPEWINALDASLLVDHLVRWIGQRPVFFSGSQWQATLEELARLLRGQASAGEEWVDCITGQGSRRRDPVQRLLALHGGALGEVDAMLAEARARFYADVTRPGADVDLDGPADQVTAYRPESLAVGACPQSNTCGASAELPVSRALLGLFPNAYLLADQIGMGELALCYENVRWVDRSATPARHRASQVADYHGRLSFDLVGTFERGATQDADAVFRYRLTDGEARHYLFAEHDEEILDMACPLERLGQSITSRLPDDHPGMVPNRLTYFASSPTTPEAQMLSNWDQGAEWRDWFVTGRGVERLEAVDGSELQVAVQAALAALSARRERQLTAPLINPPRAEEEDPMALAMAGVSESAALLRRVLELHYPRIIRQYAPVRAMLGGEQGLVTRDRIRFMRDSGVPAAQMARIGLERVERFRNAWLALPAELRERGQRAPELDYARERLARLRRQLEQ